KHRVAVPSSSTTPSSKRARHSASAARYPSSPPKHLAAGPRWRFAEGDPKPAGGLDHPARLQTDIHDYEILTHFESLLWRPAPDQWPAPKQRTWHSHPRRGADERQKGHLPVQHHCPELQSPALVGR